jgi:hypothetical protein
VAKRCCLRRTGHVSNAHRALPRSRHLAPASCVDKIVSFSAEPEPLNFCSIAEPHTTSRLRIDLIPRPPSNIQTPSLGKRNTRLDVFSSSTHRHARISNCFLSLRDLSHACGSPTARRASLSSVAPVSRVRDSGSTFLITKPIMASEMTQDAVVPKVNGIDGSLAAVESTSEAVNAEATKALVNG